MPDPAARTAIATCTCGQVAIEATSRPIFTAACHCHSCQAAGAELAALPGAPPILEADGGTALVLWRKDRVRCLRGAERLRAHRLRSGSKTRRVVAGCCNSAMFLDFTAGHWVSFYRDRFPPGARPPVDLRVMTRDRRPGVAFADTMPSYSGKTGGFMWKLLLAWAAMGLRTPMIDWVPGTIAPSTGAPRP
jgi:hypothetical protein